MGTLTYGSHRVEGLYNVCETFYGGSYPSESSLHYLTRSLRPNSILELSFLPSVSFWGNIGIREKWKLLQYVGVMFVPLGFGSLKHGIWS